MLRVNCMSFIFVYLLVKDNSLHICGRSDVNNKDIADPAVICLWFYQTI